MIIYLYCGGIHIIFGLFYKHCVTNYYVFLLYVEYLLLQAPGVCICIDSYVYTIYLVKLMLMINYVYNIYQWRRKVIIFGELSLKLNYIAS